MRVQPHQHATRKMCDNGDKPLDLNIIVQYESSCNVATPCFKFKVMWVYIQHATSTYFIQPLDGSSTIIPTPTP